MRNRTFTKLLLCAMYAFATAVLTLTAQGQAGIFQNPPANLGTQTMPANNGWASVTGTAPSGPYTPYTVTGGSAALPANIYTVHNFAELKNALQAGGASTSNTAKIIYVSGTITASLI